MYVLENMNDLKYCYKYPHPAVAADCVIFGYDGNTIKVLLILRANDPYKGKWAFPGGFMNMDETVEQCAARELEEETGLKDVIVKQFHIFSAVDRDPRERVISIAHYAVVKLSEVKGCDDAENAQWFDFDEMPELAFDHEEMFCMALQLLIEKMSFKPEEVKRELTGFSEEEFENLQDIILKVKIEL